MMKKLLYTVLLIISFYNSFSQITWDGGGDGVNWSSANNWSTNIVPTSADNVSITNASVTVDVAAVCNNLTIGTTNNNTTLTVSGSNSLAVGGNLIFNSSNAGATYTLNVNAGTASVAGTVSSGGTGSNAMNINITSGNVSFTNAVGWTWGTKVNLTVSSTGFASWTAPLTLNTAATTLLISGGGTLTFNGLVTQSNGTISNTTTAGTVNFNGGYTKSTGTFTTMANETINFGGNFTNSSAALTLNATSTAVFNGGAPAITPTVAITFGNFTISGVNVTLNGNISIAGNWTNNGGTLTGGANTVTLRGTASTIGGTSSTAFPNLTIGGTNTNRTYTMNNNNSCNNFTILAQNANQTLLLNGVTFTVNGNVTLNQPTGNNRTALLNVAGGICNVTGNLIFTGTTTDIDRVAKVNVDAGSFSLTGSITWMANSSVPSEVIALGNGNITFGSSLNMPDNSGTLSITGSGTVNFNGAAAPSFEFNEASANTDPVFTTSSGCTLNFFNGFTNNEDALTIANGSFSVFTGNGTITPNAAITFGNLTINAGVNLTLGGNISLTNNWTNSGGTLLPGTNTVTFSGTIATQQINGPETFYILTTNQSTSTIQLNSDIMVTNTLNMSGHKFNLNGFYLTLGNSAGAILTRTTGQCYGGYFKRWWPTASISTSDANKYGLFPIGSSTYYRPIEINSTANPTTAGYVTAIHVDALTVTDVSYTDNLSNNIEAITDMYSTLKTSADLGGTYTVDVTMNDLSPLGTTSKLKQGTIASPYGVGTAEPSPAVVSGGVANPTVRRTGVTGTSLYNSGNGNDFVVTTIDRATTPIRKFYFSFQSGNWNDGNTWRLTPTDIVSCGCTPIPEGYVVIMSTHTVTVNVTSTIQSVAYIDDNANLNGAANFTVNGNLTTLASGIFSPSSGTWTVNGNVLLQGTGFSSTSPSAAMNIGGNLEILNTTQLSLANNLTVSGNLNVNGTLALGTNNLTLNGTNKSIGGTGSITGTGSINITTSKTIDAASNFSINGIVALSANTTVTNYGTISINNNLTGANATTSIWTNEAGSTLNITGALLTTGELNALASPNTVNYNGSGAQTVKRPSSGTYYNLICSNAGTKSMGDAGFTTYTVTNMVTIQDAAVLDETASGCGGGGGSDCDLTGAGLTMSGTAQFLVVDKSNNTYPELSGGYTLSGGTVSINISAGNPVVRGKTYYNLTLTGSRSFNLASLTDVANSFVYSSTGNTDVGNTLSVGNITLSTGAGTLDGKTFTITVEQGDWINNSGAFTASTSKVIFGSSNPQTIGGTAVTTFYNLEINNSSLTGVTLAQPCSLSSSGTLTLTNGELILNSKTLTIQRSAAGAIAGGSSASYIKSENENSKLQWNIGTTIGDYYFPFGIDGVYIPFRLNKTTAGTGAGSYTLSTWYTAGNATLPTAVNDAMPCGGIATENDVTDRFWVITLAGYTANPTADVYFYYNEAELDGISESDLVVQRYNTSGTSSCDWEPYDESHPQWSVANVNNISRDGTSNYVKVAGISSFSPWAMSKKSAPLPISLLSFDAQLENAVVNLTWATATEINNDFFTIEKTKDGKEFEEVIKIKGAGNSSDAREYKTKDENPYKGISYYRLKQTDFDGKYTYSDLVAVNNPEGKEVVFTIFPNPTTNSNINVSIAGYEKNEEVLVVLNDIQGKQVFSKVILTDDNGSFVTAVDPQKQLPSGMYFVVGSSRNDIYSRKLIIK